jgi:ABC-type xylose transport system permease subunit
VGSQHYEEMSVAFRLIRSEYLVLLLCGALFTALAPFTPGLATRENAGNMLGSLAPLLIVALGQTLVLIAGGIDLSVTSIIALTSIAGAAVMNRENGWLKDQPLAMPIGVGVMLLLGALVGAGNGLAVTKLRMPAFIVTLTTMMFFSGLAIWLTKSKNIAGLPSAFTSLGNGLWIALGIASVLAVLVHVLLSRSLFGRWLYAVGHNPRTAHVSGVPVDGVVIAVLHGETRDGVACSRSAHPARCHRRDGNRRHESVWGQGQGRVDNLWRALSYVAGQCAQSLWAVAFLDHDGQRRRHPVCGLARCDTESVRDSWFVFSCSLP